VTLALIDGDIVAYRAASAVQQDYGFGIDADPVEAARATLQTIQAWMRLGKCRDCIVAFTGRENWRKRILPSYKANRAGKVKPLAFLSSVEAVMERFKSHLIEGLEGDDILGILATTPKYDGAIVMSVDKDLRTIPGLHLNPMKETKPVNVSGPEAAHKWLTQALTGDTSDGYVGIPGVGPKKAADILGTPWAADTEANLLLRWERVVAAYHKAKLTEEDALVQARVARILRRSDYDTPNKQVILWHPTTPVRLPLEGTVSSTPA
jgi:DNA polymerase-1